MTSTVDVVEFTDPCCSWAWGTEPKLRLLRWRHGHRFRWRRVMGGLVDDSAAAFEAQHGAPWDAVKAAGRLREYWRPVGKITGMPYPVHLRAAPRTSHVANRAVKAAEMQDEAASDRLLRRLRERLHVFGLPFDTPDDVRVAAAGISGIDLGRLVDDIDGPDVRAAYERDLKETRDPNEYVRSLDDDRIGNGMAKPDGDDFRYAFPTIVFAGSGGEHTIAGWAEYDAYVAAAERAEPGVTADAAPDPSPEQALERFGLLTDREVRVLCGEDSAPPAGATNHDWGDGVVYLAAGEEVPAGS